VIIRLEELEDRVASIEVERAAFGTGEEAGIVEAVRDEPDAFALVAVEGRAIVGHVQMSRAWVGDSSVLALGPIGVLPERQGAGIGSALTRASLERARRHGEAAVILLGSPDYYGRLGFVPASDYGLANPFAGQFEDGFTIAEEDFQIAVLDEGRARDLTGRVRWHPSFG
jgi:putative acetyltransferase